jgi:predicted Rossmann fold nucleotide-binding protein DprA/Smf involved in DNA uptake
VGQEESGILATVGWLGSVCVPRSASGTASFDISLPQTVPGEFLTSTATDPSGNTSEFSRDVNVQSATQFLATRVDDLIARTTLTVSQVMATLSVLELKRLVRRSPGHRFVRA